MAKTDTEIKKLYYSISEVSKIADLKQYVLRYWETEFSQLHPQKNRAGNRTYRQKDIDVVLKIKDLLYTQKFTIEGARQQLKSGGGKSSPVNKELNEKYANFIQAVKSGLQDILTLLGESKS
jgi:DNA-binding transcriptional MerR regulator|tara:strand:- start:142 stop:507 length:366 start_codon:yes stop_codon:yes gene_type:complete